MVPTILCIDLDSNLMTIQNYQNLIMLSVAMNKIILILSSPLYYSYWYQKPIEKSMKK